MIHVSNKNFNLENSDNYYNQFILNKPFPHFVIDDFLENESAKKILNNFKINKHWTNSSLVNNYKKYGLNNRKYMDKNCNDVIDELGSDAFIQILSKVTGIKNIFLDPHLDGGGLHQIFNGGSLNLHTDFNSHTIEKKWKRVLNIIIYLNENWVEEYNGNLEFWDDKIKKKGKSIMPIFNRCVIFQTNKKSFHGHPETLNLPQNISRKSLAAYYFVKEDKSLKLYSTKFVGRPKDTIFYKFLIGVDTFLNKIFSFLKRYRIVNDKFASKILDLFN